MNAPGAFTPAALLRLDPRDVRGLKWLRARARTWLTALKRRRKYRPRGNFEDDEAELLQALVDLEKVAARVLDLGAVGTEPRKEGNQ